MVSVGAGSVFSEVSVLRIETTLSAILFVLLSEKLPITNMRVMIRENANVPTIFSNTVLYQLGVSFFTASLILVS